MLLIHLVLILIVIAILVALMNRYLAEFMDGNILKLINIVVIIACVLFVLQAFGVFEYIGGVRVRP